MKINHEFWADFCQFFESAHKCDIDCPNWAQGLIQMVSTNPVSPYACKECREIKKPNNDLFREVTVSNMGTGSDPRWTLYQLDFKK